MGVNKLLITIIAILPLLTFTLKFTLSIPGLEKNCFYEMLGDSQKYALEVIPKNQPKYDLEIAYSTNGRWESIYYKMTTLGYERIQIHKLATMATTHSFCIKNIQRQVLEIIVRFNTGVELMDFQLLPEKSDAQNLAKQVKWLQDQKKGLYATISDIEVLKTSTINISQLLSTKMFIFAIIGLVGVIGVNFIFYQQVKKTFKERKLI